MLFLFVLSLFDFVLFAQAVLVNSTIDDSGGFVNYTPEAAWSSGPQCAGCIVKPDASRLTGQTWHESLFSANSGPRANVPLTATVLFNGSAVYVFCAVSRGQSPAGDSNMVFLLDGHEVGTFSQRATNSAGFDYQFPVYTNLSLPAGQHTLTVQNGVPDQYDSLMILDSILFTHDDGLPAPSAIPSAAADETGQQHKVSGATVAVICVLLLVLFIFLGVLGFVLYRRRRKRRPIYAQYMPEGAIRAFPTFLAPTVSRASGNTSLGTPVSATSSFNSFAHAGPSVPLPAYAGNTQGSWWVGRDQKTPGVATHRPFDDPDPDSARIQRPQPWEMRVPA